MADELLVVRCQLANGAPLAVRAALLRRKEQLSQLP